MKPAFGMKLMLEPMSGLSNNKIQKIKMTVKSRVKHGFFVVAGI